jgi:probable DNA metabolism protein
MIRLSLRGRGDLAEWRDAARALLRAGVGPGDVEWRVRDAGADLFGMADDPLPPPDPSLHAPTVPAAFLTLADAVICHADPARFALLYRLLWRVQRERALLSNPSDADVARAETLTKAIRRDAHKMKAFVRFKEMEPPQNGRRRFAAWFEPDNYIVGRTAGFFQRRFTDMDWIITTPKGSAAWDGQQLTLSDEPSEKPDLIDDTDDLWRTYFAHIFNPARLKVRAMQSEMPKKYWKNLPEADLIPDLIAGAEDRMRKMIEREATQPKPFHYRLRERD